MLFSIGISCWAPRVLFSFFPFGLFGRNKRKTIHFYKFTCLLFFFLSSRLSHHPYQWKRVQVCDIACRKTAISKSKCIVLAYTHIGVSIRSKVFHRRFSMFVVLGARICQCLFGYHLSVCSRSENREQGTGNREWMMWNFS